MKFIKLFKEQTAFDKAKSTLDRPNVSLVKENNNVYLLKKKNANGYSYVDLGLPSDTLWATMNVGATSETDYGNYFMWGSTKANTPDECTWAKAPFNGGNTSYNADAFNQVKDTVCPNGILAKEYDAASKIMGGDWRMPTKAEFDELLSGTTKEWTQMSSVNGWKFTSKTDTSKYIFIPAAGYCYGGSVSDVGSGGGVWSSSLNASYPNNALYLFFNSGECNMDYNGRYVGWSVRGVL